MKKIIFCVLSSLSLTVWATEPSVVHLTPEKQLGGPIKVAPETNITSNTEQQGVIYDANHKAVGKVMGYSYKPASASTGLATSSLCNIKCQKPPYQGGPVHIPVEPSSPVGVLK